MKPQAHTIKPVPDLVGDDFEQHHLVHGGEVVHAHKLLGSLAGGGELGNGDGGGIASKHAVRGGDLLNLFDDLQREVGCKERRRV